MSRHSTSVTAIALTAWASFGFSESSRAQLTDTSSALVSAQLPPDRLAPVRRGQETVLLECQGEQVSLIQTMLNQHGVNPPLKVSGIFDQGTDLALRNFQSTNCGPTGRPLARDGIVGTETLWALEHSPSEASPHRFSGPLAEVLNQTRLYKEGDSGPAVLELKRLLNKAGASPRLLETAVFDRATVHAVVRFQSAWNSRSAFSEQINIPIDGLVKRKTAQALLAASESPLFNREISAGRTLLKSKPRGMAALASDRTFETALAIVLKAEGGLSSDPQDRGNRGGNVTMQGVTQRVYDEFRALHKTPLRSVAHITPQEVKQLYYEMYWLGGRCNRLPIPVAVAHFNASVNLGRSGAAGILQEALDVRIDKVIGRRTIQAALQVDSYSAAERYQNLVARKYQAIASVDSNKKYLTGWLHRLEQVSLACGLAPTSLPPMVAMSPSTREPVGISIPEGIQNFQAEVGLAGTGILDEATAAELLQVRR
ncbi:MAG: peptidoglycan-binding protein [Deltaproteobacteria bacterium]|nr:peptidoglycan-binding protein [Deltaproteobacteria bacterium]